MIYMENMIVAHNTYTNLYDRLIDMVNDAKRIDNLQLFIDEKIAEYKAVMANVAYNYEQGLVQQCVKVESDTVHLNMIKLLNTIKSMLNENSAL